MNKTFKNVTPEAIARDLRQLVGPSNNIYESIVAIGKRARSIAEQEKMELHNKLDEFAPASDNLEEVFENKEQIEISAYYEKLPKASLQATEEFIAGEIDYQKIQKPEDDTQFLID